MLFSVLIPAYNAERYLEECLASLEAQTFQDFEVIIIDDGSTDATASICDKFATRRANVVVFHKENEGRLLARRDALEVVRGNYVVFLDSDDALRSDALSLIADAIRDSGVEMVAFGMSNSPDFSKPQLCGDFPLNAPVGRGGDLARRAVLKGRFNTMWGKAFSLATFDLDVDYGRWKGLMHGEDLFQLLPVLDKVEKATFIPEPLYFYRRHEASSTQSYKPKQLDDIAAVSSRVIEYGDRWGVPGEAARCVLMQYCSTLKIMWRDPLYATQRKGEYERARTLILNCSAISRHEFIKSLRLDNRMLVNAVLSGNWRATDMIIGFVEVLKRMHPLPRKRIFGDLVRD